MTKTQILQIVGYSSTGKTTFITQLIKRIKGEGKSISVIKSARLHPYDFTRKDSDVFMLSGADISSVIFEDITQISLGRQLNLEKLIDILTKISVLDLILIEGFKDYSFDKVLFLSINEDEWESLLKLQNIKYIYMPKEIEFKGFRKQEDTFKHLEDLIFTDMDTLVEKILKGTYIG
ncbi:MAG: molybdopterin-guanine dinucleotide biosynthesis protein B [Candidatus Heimdallarchaeaceae archaeon]